MMKRITIILIVILAFSPVVYVFWFSANKKDKIDSNGKCIEARVVDILYYSDAAPSIKYEYLVNKVKYEATDGRLDENIGDKIVIKYKEDEPSESYVLSGCIVRYVKDKVTCECE